MRFHCKNALSCVRQTGNRYALTSRRWISHKPLRILFCGSDDFSIHSLKAISKLHQDEPERISQIKVLCRPDKHVGRGLKEIRAQPIKTAAKELDLDVIEVDTFQGSTQELSPIDLIITVSFGLLVPESIISLAQYGGINVHPSLLPQFRGAAPIQHALLRRVKTTGVSIQTMHPTKFDHGIVLDQEEIALEHEPTLTTQKLLETLTPIGGDLLTRTLQQERFIDPKSVISESVPEKLYKAPKITKLDRRIDWKRWTADDILTRHRVLDDLWDEETVPLILTSDTVGKGKASAKRVVFHGPWSTLPPDSFETVETREHILLLRSQQEAGKNQLAFRTCDGKLVVPSSATIESQSKGKGLSTLLRRLE